MSLNFSGRLNNPGNMKKFYIIRAARCNNFMGKLGIIYILSFFGFLLLLCSIELFQAGIRVLDVPFILAPAVIIFIAAFGYQLAYIFHFCKKDGVSRSRSVATFILCAWLCLAIHEILFFIDIYYNGYDCACPAGRMGGMTAWEHLSRGKFPSNMILMCGIYLMCYVITGVILIIKKRKNIVV